MFLIKIRSLIFENIMITGGAVTETSLYRCEHMIAGKPLKSFSGCARSSHNATDCNYFEIEQLNCG